MPQSLAKVYLHAIFSTKNREPVLHDDWRDELFRVISFQDEFRDFLRRYEIEWDERYVWD